MLVFNIDNPVWIPHWNNLYKSAKELKKSQRGEKEMGDEAIIYCRKEGCKNPVCEEHHIVPKHIGGQDKDGRVYLCKKHHNILYLMLLGKIFEWYVPPDKVAECFLNIKEFSVWWIKQNDR